MTTTASRLTAADAKQTVRQAGVYVQPALLFPASQFATLAERLEPSDLKAAIDALQRGLQAVTDSENHHNCTVALTDTFGRPYAIYVGNGGITLYGNFMGTQWAGQYDLPSGQTKDARAARRAAVERLDEDLRRIAKGDPRCSRCEQWVPTVGSYFAGRYCEPCWNAPGPNGTASLRVQAARETYE